MNVCTTCGKSYMYKSTLIRHNTEQHGTGEVMNACTYGCGLLTKRRYDMTKHEMKCKERFGTTRAPETLVVHQETGPRLTIEESEFQIQEVGTSEEEELFPNITSIRHTFQSPTTSRRDFTEIPQPQTSTPSRRRKPIHNITEISMDRTKLHPMWDTINEETTSLSTTPTTPHTTDDSATENYTITENEEDQPEGNQDNKEDQPEDNQDQPEPNLDNQDTNQTPPDDEPEPNPEINKETQETTLDEPDNNHNTQEEINNNTTKGTQEFEQTNPPVDDEPTPQPEENTIEPNQDATATIPNQPSTTHRFILRHTPNTRMQILISTTQEESALQFETEHPSTCTQQ